MTTMSINKSYRPKEKEIYHNKLMAISFQKRWQELFKSKEMQPAQTKDLSSKPEKQALKRSIADDDDDVDDDDDDDDVFQT